VIVIPAIDLMRGKAVRLAQGEADRATEYHDDPPAIAEAFGRAGARIVHVVDLDGAFAGRSAHLEMLTAIASRAHAAGAQVQSGGGIRDADGVERLLAAGADRVVVGTLAVREPDVVRGLCQRHPDRIVVAADSRGGKVAVDGWTSATEQTPQALATAAAAWGAAAILFTDVSRDGMRTGPAIEATRALQDTVDIPVLASGGVGSLAHLDACVAAGIRGVVLGRALYEGVFTLEEALARC
jgi:phosphoribosylformimino-5-aminoimidazole carboxamide ribotide isomerase